MDETLTFFAQLLSMTRRMVDSIIPDLLLESDQQTIERLRYGAEEVDHSLQVFIKLCTAVSQGGNLRERLVRRPDAKTMEMNGEVRRIIDGQRPSSQISMGSESVISNFSDLSVHNDDEKGDPRNDHLWQDLLTKALDIYVTRNKRRVPKLFFCCVCNKFAKAEKNWEAHLAEERHVLLAPHVPAVQYICDICGLHVYGDIESTTNIIQSNEHDAFDEAIDETRPISTAPYSVSDIFGKRNAPKQETDGHNNCTESDEPSRNSSVSVTPVENDDSKPVQKTEVRGKSKKKTVFQHVEIHRDFVDITDEIANYIENHEPFRIAYCRPCEVICETEELWVEHRGTKKHTSKMSMLHFKNVRCRCLQCDFLVVAGLKIAVCYMKYHIENVHCQSTDGIKNGEYMEVTDLTLGAKIQNLQTESNVSFKGSNETVRSSVTDSRCSSADFKRSSDDLKCSTLDRGNSSSPQMATGGLGYQRAGQSMSAVVSQSASTVKNTKTSANPFRSASSAFKKVGNRSEPGRPEDLSDDLILTFLQMLARKEESFGRDTTFKLFTALCVVCKTDKFDSQNAWIAHLSKHRQTDKVNEVSCSECNSRFFGDVATIKSSFLNHDMHVCIDAMFSW